jgi:hypothetical protein
VVSVARATQSCIADVTVAEGPGGQDPTAHGGRANLHACKSVLTGVSSVVCPNRTQSLGGRCSACIVTMDDAKSSMKEIILAARGVAGLMPSCACSDVPDIVCGFSNCGCPTLIRRCLPVTDPAPPLAHVALFLLKLLWVDELSGRESSVRIHQKPNTLPKACCALQKSYNIHGRLFQRNYLYGFSLSRSGLTSFSCFWYIACEKKNGYANIHNSSLVQERSANKEKFCPLPSHSDLAGVAIAVLSAMGVRYVVSPSRSCRPVCSGAWRAQTFAAVGTLRTHCRRPAALQQVQFSARHAITLSTNVNIPS